MTKIRFLFLFIPVLLMGRSYAQTDTGGSGWKLPPLEALIDSALIHSSLVKGANSTVQLSELELMDAKKDWMQRISLSSSLRYGSIYDYSSMYESEGTPTFLSITESKFAPYVNMGLNLNMPISDIVDRKRKIEKAKVKVDISESRMEDIERSVKQTVVTAYYEVMNAQEILSVRDEIKSSASVLFDQASEDYKGNKITFAEFTRINEIYLNAKSQVESQKIALLKAIRILEIIVGIRII